jgi:DNA-binding beta-propeller fold protein YncE
LEGRLLLSGGNPAATTLPATAITSTTATLNGSVNPNGSSTDASFLYSTNSTLALHVVTTLAGTAGQTGSTDGTGAAALFNDPTGVAVDAAGNVYVADTGNETIREITPAGVVTTLAGSPGQLGSADGTGAAALFGNPKGVAVDPTTGDLYVADFLNDTIRMITPGGVVTTLAGSAAAPPGSTDGTGTAARFNEPAGIAVDPTTGNVYVADTYNDTIRMITPAGVVTTLAGTAGQIGSADGTGAAARFNEPEGVAVDAAGNVYVADTDNRTIREITPAGVVTTLAGSPGQGGSADGTGAAAQFDYPADVAVDAAGNVYVADEFNNTIREITPTGVVTTLAGTAGQYGSTDGTGTAARFTDPIGVAVDAAGNVYVADNYNNTIRKLSPPPRSSPRAA